MRSNIFFPANRLNFFFFVFFLFFHSRFRYDRLRRERDLFNLWHRTNFDFRL